MLFYLLKFIYIIILLITELLGRKNKVKFNLGYFFIITFKFQFLF